MKPPSNFIIENYVEKCFNSMYEQEINKENVIEKFLQKFKSGLEDMCTVTIWKKACHVVSKKLVNRSLALRKQLVGELLKIIRVVGKQSIGDDTFEEDSHTISSEPYFHDTAYKDPALEVITIIDRKNRRLATKMKSHVGDNEYSMEEIVIAVDKNGKCYMDLDEQQSTSKTWKCSLSCKKFCDKDRQSIMDFISIFENESVEEARDLLQNLDDGCEHGHYNKRCDFEMEKSNKLSHLSEFKELKGHPLPCSFEHCNSQLRILRAGAVHHPFLRTLLNNIYCARRNDNDIRKVETCLSEGCIHSLIDSLNLKDLSELLDEEEEESSSTIQVKPLSTSDSYLEVEFAGIIETFMKN